MTVTALPVSSVRSPASRTVTSPVRAPPLQADEFGAAQAGGPEGGQRGVGATGDRVLVDAQGGEEAAGDEVVAAGGVLGGGGDDDPPAAVAAQGGEVGRELAYGPLVGQLHDQVADVGGGVVDRLHLGAQGAPDLGHGLDPGQGGGREVHGQGPVLRGLGREDAAARGEADQPAREAAGDEDVRGGEGRVAAHVHLGGRREPAQRPAGLAAGPEGMGEGGLGEVDLGGDLLQPGVRWEPVFEEQDPGGVAAEGAVGEGVDDSDAHAIDRREAGEAAAKANPG